MVIIHGNEFVYFLTDIEAKQNTVCLNSWKDSRQNRCAILPLCKICQFSVKVVIFFADQEVNPASESVNTSGSLPSFDNQVWGLALYKKSSVLNLETSAIHHRRGAFKTG